jgi:hypothetical protein
MTYTMSRLRNFVGHAKKIHHVKVLMMPVSTIYFHTSQPVPAEYQRVKPTRVDSLFEKGANHEFHHHVLRHVRLLAASRRSGGRAQKEIRRRN